MYTIIDGKATANSIKDELAKYAEHIDFTPCLAVIIVGTDPASQVYVRNKHKVCQEIGFESRSYELPEDVSEQELIKLINDLNTNNAVHGILVQLPLPKHLNEAKILAEIRPSKDVDAFHSMNVGKIMQGNYEFLPCTPAGVMALLRHYNIEVEGKECVVVGRSNIVGKPMAMLLLQANGTVTICHSKTKNLKEVCKRADILITAIGKPEFFDASYIKEGAVVIDVGINRRASDNKLVGDVLFEDVAPHTSFITPVPGGCGPMTVVMLMQNTLRAAELLEQ